MHPMPKTMYQFDIFENTVIDVAALEITDSTSTKCDKLMVVNSEPCRHYVNCKQHSQLDIIHKFVTDHYNALY